MTGFARDLIVAAFEGLTDPVCDHLGMVHGRQHGPRENRGHQHDDPAGQFASPGQDQQNHGEHRHQSRPLCRE